jgi:hypothetical protein
MILPQKLVNRAVEFVFFYEVRVFHTEVKFTCYINEISSGEISSNDVVLDPLLKHYKLLIEGQRLACIDDSDSPVICCLNSIMADTGTNTFRWSIKVHRHSEGMWIGICQIRQAQSHNFDMWDWSYIGHGHYCVD